MNDELRMLWARQRAHREPDVHVDAVALAAVLRRGLRWRLGAYAGWRAVELAVATAVAFAAGLVAHRHVDEGRYCAIACVVAGHAGGAALLSARLLWRWCALDHAGPVLVLQQAVERLRLAEARAVLWALLGGVVVWLPLPLVLVEALGGPPLLGQVDGAWLAANLAFGLAVLMAAVWWARGATGNSPFAGRLADALAGRSLQRARAALQELAAFERDDAER